MNSGAIESSEALLSPVEVAEMTGLTRITIYRALETGDLVGFKVGNGPRPRWRIRIEDVEHWLRAG